MKWILCLMLVLPTFVSGQNINTIYSIKIATYAKAFDAQSIEQLEKYGVLKYEPTDWGTRIYLGQYLDKRTAKLVRNKVRKMGFKGAYLTSDNYKLNYADGKYMDGTYQIASFKNLDLTAVKGFLRDPSIGEHLYIQYDKGYYKLSMGLYASQLAGTKEECERRAYIVQAVFGGQGFGRIFRKAEKLEAIPSYP